MHDHLPNPVYYIVLCERLMKAPCNSTRQQRNRWCETFWTPPAAINIFTIFTYFSTNPDFHLLFAQGGSSGRHLGIPHNLPFSLAQKQGQRNPPCPRLDVQHCNKLSLNFGGNTLYVYLGNGCTYIVPQKYFCWVAWLAPASGRDLTQPCIEAFLRDSLQSLPDIVPMPKQSTNINRFR